MCNRVERNVYNRHYARMMFSKATEELLNTHVPSLPQMVMARSFKHDMDELVAGVLPPMKIAVVDDIETGAVLGEQVMRALKTRFAAVHVQLKKAPKADDVTVEYIRKETAGCGALVAVGSGTINDLCKYAAFLDKKPYIVFPTAASMNGYLSANTSLTIDGFKKTCPAAMPTAVFCDRSVLAKAPSRLSKSGLGDSLARPTAQADWLMSHLVLGTPYNEVPFELIKPYEPELFEQARGVALGDEDSIELLMRVLLLSGLGMTIAGGSYPASQGEHMVAHAMDMMTPPPPVTLHGEAIGVTSLALARRQEILLGIDAELLPDNFDVALLTELYGAHATEEAKTAFAEKHKAIAAAANRMKDWKNIAHQLEKIMLSPSRIEAILKQGQAPTSHQQLGWNDKQYMSASATARFLRDRFTFLDLN